MGTGVVQIWQDTSRQLKHLSRKEFPQPLLKALGTLLWRLNLQATKSILAFDIGVRVMVLWPSCWCVCRIVLSWLDQCAQIMETHFVCGWNKVPENDNHCAVIAVKSTRSNAHASRPNCLQQACTITVCCFKKFKPQVSLLFADTVSVTVLSFKSPQSDNIEWFH